MEKTYQPQKVEKKIYQFWKKGGYFTPKIEPRKKPYTITLPPPNVTGGLHAGHAMYVVEDIMVRYHRMKGEPTLWLPGFD
ncbi:class I tRNA ligase family protein, partial [Patescibacteria group bacterium]|nr:class I tRNA ligase family protein [Patescibacteria group bacterium]